VSIGKRDREKERKRETEKERIVHFCLNCVGLELVSPLAIIYKRKIINETRILVDNCIL